VNRRIRLASLIAVIVTLSGLLASPAKANEASGYLSVSSNTLDGQRGIQRFTFSMQLDDRDGISSSYVTCTNKAGFQVFSLRFARIPMEAYFLNESASPVIKLLNFKELTSATSGRYASRMIFDVPIAAIWKRNETCIAATFVEDRFGNVKQVDADTLTLVNNLVAAAPAPNVPNPTNTPDKPNPTEIESCKADAALTFDNYLKPEIYFSDGKINIKLPTYTPPKNCRAYHYLIIKSVTSKAEVLPSVLITSNEFSIPAEKIFERVLELTLQRNTISIIPNPKTTVEMFVLDPNSGSYEPNHISYSSKLYLPVSWGEPTIDSLSQAKFIASANKASNDKRFASLTYPSCTIMNGLFPKGISKQKSKSHPKSYISKVGYLGNIKLDKDKDGVACEK
jgi:hypothetical protein